MNIVNAKGAFDIRPAEEGDLDYILSSWQLTWERSPEMNSPGMIRDEYFRHAHLILDELISRSSENGALYICHQPGAPHLIRGYLCGEVRSWGGVDVAYLHWMQVKKRDWRQGVRSRASRTIQEGLRHQGGPEHPLHVHEQRGEEPEHLERGARHEPRDLTVVQVHLPGTTLGRWQIAPQ